MRILIAEDEMIIRLDLRSLLERAGYDVVGEARDGEEAVTLARELEPDLAVMDVKMPKLDGIEAARQMMEARPLPIVMLTAFGEQDLVSRAVDVGVFGYLVKPFREHDVLPAIEAARARFAELESVSLAGTNATALALVFSELLSNALEHGGPHVKVELATENGNIVLAISDDGPGIVGEPTAGTGLSIVRALVRDELRGTLDLHSEGGTRAEVRFPAE